MYDVGMSYLAGISGLSGAGKSTAVRNVGNYLSNEGLRVASFHDRTAAPTAAAIDKQLRAHLDLPAWERLRLIVAARREVVRHCVLPALQTHDVVLMDRYYPCSIAYQGYGEGLDITFVTMQALRSVRGALPNRSFILDLPGEAVAERLATQADIPHMFDDQATDFHERVRQGYLHQAANQPENFTVINAAQPPEEVSHQLGTAILHDLEALRTPAAP